MLKRKRDHIASRIELEKMRLAELDKQIETIENGTQDIEKIRFDVIWRYPHSIEDQEIKISMHAIDELIKAGEKNDRKRTQPLIDAVKEYQKCSNGVTITGMFKALKTLGDHEENGI